MALPTFTESSLGVSPEWLAQVTRGLANRGLAAPVASAIAEAVQMIADYTALYTLESLRWERLMRPIAIYILHSQLGQVPESAKLGYERAIKELEAIRDGKFTDLPEASTPVQTVEPRAGNWGSREKLTLR
jgi:hypothetical protein